jgi:hypothetical protein
MKTPQHTLTLTLRRVSVYESSTPGAERVTVKTFIVIRVLDSGDVVGKLNGKVYRITRGGRVWSAQPKSATYEIV